MLPHPPSSTLFPYTTLFRSFPPNVPVAGDANPAVNSQAPTYASFAGVATYENRNHIAPNRVGNTVNESINSGGTVGNQVPPAAQIPPVKSAVYDQAGGHNIAAPFWEFLNRKGQVLANG